MFNPNKRGGSVDRAYLNNNMILQNNIQIQNQNNMINFFNMCPMMVMMNCLGDFNNIGGGGAKNIFPMNQFNNNMNQINNNVNNNYRCNRFINIGQMNNNINNNNRCIFNNLNQMNNNNNRYNQFNNNFNPNFNLSVNNNIKNCNNCIMQNNKPKINHQKDNFAFAFRHSNSNEIPNNNHIQFNPKPNIPNLIKENNNEIQLKFSFLTGESFDISGKHYERLSEVINRFKSYCPDQLKKFLSYCLCNGISADKNKTLQELGLRNNQVILFLENKNNKNENRMTFRERVEYRKFAGEYYALKILDTIEKNKNKLNPEKFESYNTFYNKKDKSTSISVNEHNHLLVYCLTNFNWKCNVCNIEYDKFNGRYYCSKCDFNLCENCHYIRKYKMKKSFPKNTCPSNLNIKINFLNTPYHEEHSLVYCRCSKNLASYNDWTCNNCLGNYTNDKWLFYCTLCNYHLCCGCCGY